MSDDVDLDEKFDLNEDDLHAIEIAVETARQLLRKSTIPGETIIGLGQFLYVAERLPEITDGAEECSFSIVVSAGDEDFRERRCIRFCADPYVFEISRGVDRSEFDGWRIERDGCSARRCELSHLPEEIQTLLNTGGEIEIGGCLELDE